MRALSAVAVVLVAVIGLSVIAAERAAAALPACRSICVRKEWSSLSQPEVDAWVNAVMKLQARQPVATTGSFDPSTMSYSDFVYIHVKFQQFVHGTNMFYPFHRIMLLLWEQALQSTGYPGCQPYWDWTMDKFYPTSSLSPTFGTVGVGADNCVVDGALAQRGFIASTDFPSPMFPRSVQSSSDSCVQRVPNVTVPFFNGILTFQCFDRLTDFVSFQSNTELTYHPNVHYGVGGVNSGDLADASYSPNDALFWLHHAQVDRYWALWQASCPSQFIHDKIGGVGFGTGQYAPFNSAAALDSTVNDVDLDINNVIPYFHSYTVADSLDITKLCYTYAESINDIPLNKVPGCLDEPSVLSTTLSAKVAPSVNNDPVKEDRWIFDIIAQIAPAVPSLNQSDLSSTLSRRGYTSQRLLDTNCTLHYGWYPSTASCPLPSIIKFKDGDVEVPETLRATHRLLYLSPTIAKLVSKSFEYDHWGGDHKGTPDFVILHSPKSVGACDRDETIAPPDAHAPDEMQYSALFPHEWYDRMGLSYAVAVETNCKLMKFVDEYNQRIRDQRSHKLR